MIRAARVEKCSTHICIIGDPSSYSDIYPKYEKADKKNMNLITIFTATPEEDTVCDVRHRISVCDFISKSHVLMGVLYRGDDAQNNTMLSVKYTAGRSESIATSLKV
jgi:hypothetical protein